MISESIENALFQSTRRAAMADGRLAFNLDDLALAFYGLRDKPQIADLLEVVFDVHHAKVAWPAELVQRWKVAQQVAETRIPPSMGYSPTIKKALQSAWTGSGHFNLRLLAERVLQSNTFLGRDLRRMNRPQTARNPSRPPLKQEAQAAVPKTLAEALRSHLQARILGQDTAIQTLVEAYHQSLLCPSTLGIRGLVTLLGPPGTGKTSLCRAFARGIAPNAADPPLLVIDVGTYTTAYSQDQLFGFSKSYTGAQPGILTDFVRHNPEAIILFDELEKAHPHLLHALLGLLDRGEAFDNYHNQEVDFGRCWVLFTTNLGQTFFQEDPSRAWSRSMLLRLLDEACEEGRDEESARQRILTPEMVSRLAKGHLLAMRQLSGRDILEVFRRSAARKLEALKLPALQMDRDAALLLLLSESNEPDARTADARGDAFAAGLVPDLLAGADTLTPSHLQVIPGSAAREVARHKLDAVPLRIATWGDPAPFQAARSSKAIRVRQLDSEASVGQESIDAAVLHITRQAGPCAVPHLAGVPVLAFASRQGRKRVIALREEAAQWTWALPSQASALQDFLDPLRVDRVFREHARSGRVVQSHVLPLVQEGGTWVLTLDSAEEVLEAIPPSLGRSTLRMEIPKATFSQLIGLAEAKALLGAAARLLREGHGSLPIPRGYLLTGPPGTGKTSLARALAAEAGVPFFAVTPSDLASRFRDTASVRLRQVFAEATRLAPSVVFLDEIETIAGARSASMDGDVHRCVTTLLTLLDGLVQRERPILVLAGTNHPDLLDPAILRPGRFDAVIPLELPTAEEREAILRQALGQILTQASIDVRDLAARTFGSSPADLMGLARMATQWALREGRASVTQGDLEHALELAQLGPRSTLAHAPETRCICAAHEAGHAVVHAVLRPDVRISRLDILPRSTGAGGVTQMLPADARPLPTRQSILHEIAILMAGRAGEALLHEDPEAITGGCQDDLRRATQLARQGILSLGLDAEIGLVSISEEALHTTPTLADQVQSRVGAWIDEGWRMAKDLLNRHQPVWESLQQRLLQHEVLQEPVIQHLLRPLGAGTAETS